MTNEQLIRTVQRLLRTDRHLDFLQKLDQGELERLVVLIRDRLDNAA